MPRTNNILEGLQGLRQELEKRLASVEQLSELEEVRVQFLGKKGKLTQVLRQVGKLGPDKRRQVGQYANELKEHIQQGLEKKSVQLRQRELQEQLKRERIDVSLPGVGMPRGRLHPLTQVLREIRDIFVAMGFKVVKGPDIETDYNNFEALNIPPDHPARDMQDTFYITNELLLRTHTSPVQIRTMLKEKPPLAVIAPGKVYRCDADISHSPMFHQVEGLLVDQRVSFAELKGVLEVFVKRLIDPQTRLRFRPSYFPFTEPSAEVDIECVICHGKGGCRVCSESGWIEVIGCGMVHPQVFEHVGYDSTRYTGFAFGLGVERMAMLKYGIDNIRLFFENDFRFLQQF